MIYTMGVSSSLRVGGHFLQESAWDNQNDLHVCVCVCLCVRVCVCLFGGGGEQYK